MSDPPAPGPREFVTTQWSLVAAARNDEAGTTQAHRALEALCKAYWFPLYAFVRSRGYSSSDAQDLTQAFFAGLIQTGGFRGADPDRGRFRSYLLGAMKHFLANEWHRGRAQKRGGGTPLLELDALEPEARYALLAQPADPDRAFDREWAQATVARALDRLRIESEQTGRGTQFEVLRGSLTGDEADRSETAARLDISEGAVKVAVHRLRQRYRALLRAEVAETVADPSDVDDEMRYLVEVLRRRS